MSARKRKAAAMPDGLAAVLKLVPDTGSKVRPFPRDDRTLLSLALGLAESGRQPERVCAELAKVLESLPSRSVLGVYAKIRIACAACELDDLAAPSEAERRRRQHPATRAILSALADAQRLAKVLP